MSTRRGKRRQGQAAEEPVPAPEPEPEEPTSAVANGESNGAMDSSYSESLRADVDDEAANEKAQREQEDWEAFREEYYEMVEQLPLSLHRSFALMRELDDEAQANLSDLLPTIKAYISLRQSLAPRPPPPPEPPHDSAMPFDSMPSSHGPNGPWFDSRQLYAGPAMVSNSNIPPSLVHSPTVSTHLTTLSRNSRELSVSTEPKDQPSSRAFLSRIAHLSAESVKASEEKLALAQAAYNSVDRHVRSLDLIIKEHEASLIPGPPGTRPLFTPLPGMETSRPMSPKVEETAEGFLAGVISAVAASGGGPDRKKSKREREKERRRERRSKDDEETQQQPMPTVPTVVRADMPVDPHEPRYCFCNQVSYGEMIGCDYEDCDREWFHCGCVGLTAAPRGKWFCRVCEEILGRKKKKH
ncbi:hypothetical protein BOTBODRAFT_189327 [Botryobasidium botryosum FD-172 SS1]|uniref:Chromatin modification-related protein n=1 Tax=Botryobasidium botryosum (strain FD-172 SS1) TaxID=930990 RepID=A0A067MKH4_BOTB1|nr:hypothetical protein BOTBODRAFT_189327 [Botryobasidium botryosum FD-172 SS1]